MNDIELDEPVAHRLRLALKEIGEHAFPHAPQLRALPSGDVGRRPRPSRRVVLVAALLILIGAVAAVILLAREDEPSTVIVDVPSAPLRFAPAVLPDGMVPRNVQQIDGVDVQTRGEIWVRVDGSGVIDAVVSLDAVPIDEVPESSRVPSFVVESEACGAVVIWARGDVRDEMHELLPDVRCELADGRPEIDAPMPDGFQRVDGPLVGQSLYMDLDGRDRHATFEVYAPERPMSIDVLTRDPFDPDAEPGAGVSTGRFTAYPIERLGQRAYVWQPRPGVLAALASEDLTFDELAAIVAGVRELDEASWTAWLTSIEAPATTMSGDATSTSPPPELESLVRAGEQLWVARADSDPPLGLVTWPNGDLTCVALLAGDERFDGGCGSGGAMYTSRDVERLGTVWFGLAMPQAPTIEEVFGSGAVGWVGPQVADGRYLQIATSVPAGQEPKSAER